MQFGRIHRALKSDERLDQHGSGLICRVLQHVLNADAVEESQNALVYPS
jgi:hypothetical protein